MSYVPACLFLCPVQTDASAPLHFSSSHPCLCCSLPRMSSPLLCPYSALIENLLRVRHDTGPRGTKTQSRPSVAQGAETCAVWRDPRPGASRPSRAGWEKEAGSLGEVASNSSSVLPTWRTLTHPSTPSSSGTSSLKHSQMPTSGTNVSLSPEPSWLCTKK